MKTSEVVTTGFLIGGSLGVMIGAGYGGKAVLDAERADPGRGVEITACDTNYKGIIEVDLDDESLDHRVIRQLQFNGSVLGVLDSSAKGPRFNDDYADLTGELICASVIDTEGVAIEAVLTPSGNEVLSYTSLLVDGNLPEGLEWVSASAES